VLSGIFFCSEYSSAISLLSEIPGIRKLDISQLDSDSFLNTNLSKMLSSILSAAHNAVKDRKWLQTSNPNGWQDMLRRNWSLGVTSFGGPAVHFQIVRFASRELPFGEVEAEKVLTVGSSDDCLWKSTNGSMIRWYVQTNAVCHRARSDTISAHACCVQYQELFALCQALPGPGSTKMIYCINVIHCGFLPGITSFFVWRRVQQKISHGHGFLKI
jgi:hypothetical protein